MPAFQLGPCAAALVSDGALPSITIVQLSGPGVHLSGHAALEELRRACTLALDAFPAAQEKSPEVDIEAIVERAWNMAEGETAEGKEPAESEWTRFGTHCVTLALAAT